MDYTGSATAGRRGSDGLTGTGEGFDSIINCDDINGSDHADTLSGNANDNWFAVGNGNDTVTGLAGEDTYDVAAAEAGVTVDLGAGTSTGGSGTDTLSGIEDVSGSDSDDSLTGSSGANVIYGEDGNDTMAGGAGNVDGADSFDGGGGIDTVDYGKNTSSTTVHLADGVTPCAVFATGALCTTGNGVSGADRPHPERADRERHPRYRQRHVHGVAFNNTVWPNGGQNALNGCPAAAAAGCGIDTVNYSRGIRPA